MINVSTRTYFKTFFFSLLYSFLTRPIILIWHEINQEETKNDYVIQGLPNILYAQYIYIHTHRHQESLIRGSHGTYACSAQIGVE